MQLPSNLLKNVGFSGFEWSRWFRVWVIKELDFQIVTDPGQGDTETMPRCRELGFHHIFSICGIAASTTNVFGIDAAASVVDAAKLKSAKWSENLVSRSVTDFSRIDAVMPRKSLRISSNIKEEILYWQSAHGTDLQSPFFSGFLKKVIFLLN